jgi:hypothetical protein
LDFVAFLEIYSKQEHTMKLYRKRLEQEQQGINQKAGRVAWDQSSSKLTFLSKCFRHELVFIQVLTFTRWWNKKIVKMGGGERSLMKCFWNDAKKRILKYHKSFEIVFLFVTLIDTVRIHIIKKLYALYFYYYQKYD